MVLFDSGGLSIAAASVSPTGSHIAIGGRDILKVLSLSSSTVSSSSSSSSGSFSDDISLSLVEHRSLRSSTGRKTKLDLVTSDVRWHPLLPRILATASTNGAILSWDLERTGFGGGQAPVTLFRHGRTVNRIAWSPVAPTLLLSAGQDGVCRLWDMRCGGGTIEFPSRIAAFRARALSTAESQARQWCRQLLQPPLQQPYDSQPVLGNPMIDFDPRAESVRDVQFDPFSPLSFASACEDGTVQVWDMRRPHEPLRRFTAHAGLVLVLQFHPSQRGIIATGGRDRMVKIWDLEYTSSNISLTKNSVGQLNSNSNNAINPEESSSSSSSITRISPSSLNNSSGGDIKKRDWLSAVSSSSLSSSSSSSSMSFLMERCNWSSLSSSLSSSNLSRVPAAEGQIATIQTTASVAKLCWRQTAHPWEALNTQQISSSSSSSQDDLYMEEDDEDDINDGEAAAFRRKSSIQEEQRRFQEALGPYRADASIPYQLATCAALLDNLCYVWDVRNRHLPVATFGGHSDVVTCLSWLDAPIYSKARRNSQDENDSEACLSLPNRFRPWLLSASKDGRVRIHDPQSAERPQLSLPSSSLSLSALCLASYHKPMNRGTFWDEPSKKAKERMNEGDKRLLLSNHSVEQEKVCTGELRILTTSAEFALLDPSSFVIQHLANNYKTEGLSIADLCAHNANIASQVKQGDVEKAWRTIGALYELPIKIENNTYNQEEEKGTGLESGETNKVNNKIKVKKNIEEKKETDFELKHDGTKTLSNMLVEETHLHNKNEIIKLDLLSNIEDEIGNGFPIPQGFVIGLLEALAAVNPDGVLAAKGQESIVLRSSSSSSSSSIIKKNDTLTNKNLSTINPQKKTAVELAFEAIPFEFGAPLRPQSVTHTKGVVDNNFLKEKKETLLEAILERDFCALRERIALEVIVFHANRGDVQTSVTIARVLSPDIELKLGKRYLQQLNVQYIDLLHRLSLWSAASTIMSHCSDEGIRRINQQSTSVLIACGMCGRDIIEPVAPPISLDDVNNAKHNRVRCNTCKHVVSQCSICQEPVRGLYTWCQGCGHGGDKEHMNEWFVTLGQMLCPTGCGHVCAIKEIE